MLNYFGTFFMILAYECITEATKAGDPWGSKAWAGIAIMVVALFTFVMNDRYNEKRYRGDKSS